MEPRIYVATDDPEAWRSALAEPKKQWRQGYSARALAYCWHAAPVWPPEIAALWLAAAHAPLRAPEPLVKLVEHRTPLPGRGFDSQTDLFVLAKATDGELVSMVVEGKVNEPFGECIGDWKAAGHGISDNRGLRLTGLCEAVGLDAVPDYVRYQLLHRTASAVLEARRFNARYAVMIVHSFSPQMAHWDSLSEFISLYGHTAEPGRLVELAEVGGVRLFAAWARVDTCYLEA